MKAVLLAAVALLGADFAFSAEWRVSVNGSDVPLRRSRAEYYAPYAYGSFEVKGGEKVSVTAPDGTVEAFVAEKPFVRIFDKEKRRNVLVLFGETVLADSPAVTVGPFAEARFVATSGRGKEKERKREK